MTKRTCARCSLEFTPKAEGRFCKHCVRELKGMRDAGNIVEAPRPGAAAPTAPQTRPGFRPLEYRDDVEYNGVVFTGDEIHRVIHFHWNNPHDVWFKNNITSEEQLLRQIGRMIDRCPAGYRIPIKKILGNPDPKCPLCRGNGSYRDHDNVSHPMYATLWIGRKPGDTTQCYRLNGTREQLLSRGCTDLQYAFPRFVSPCQCVKSTEVEK